MSQVKESAAQGGTMQSYFYTDLDDGQVSAAIRSQVGNPNALADTGPKMCAYVSPKPTDSELRFVKQMGVTHVFTWFEKWQDVSLKELHRFVNQLERSGLRVYNIGCLEIAKSTEIILNTALALTHISCFKEFIGWLAAVGVATTTFTWEATGISSIRALSDCIRFERCCGSNIVFLQLCHCFASQTGLSIRLNHSQI
eukprot:TRINITY_DN11537_c1_g1_i2.p3 TRINITY_DN11537_c1_g1~~TRINITY_DN11537_c1_g1_i2.p3  ORF type:complete len:198 (+),score=26.58 TRINITY_DN11537_c1_g1_i2:40-633(+)